MICQECGMACEPAEYHPMAACLMFKACHDGAAVRANLANVMRYGARKTDTVAPAVDTQRAPASAALTDDVLMQAIADTAARGHVWASRALSNFRASLREAGITTASAQLSTESVDKAVHSVTDDLPGTGRHPSRRDRGIRGQSR